MLINSRENVILSLIALNCTHRTHIIYFKLDNILFDEYNIFNI